MESLLCNWPARPGYVFDQIYMLPDNSYSFIAQCRLLAGNAWPVLIAQIASISMMLIDTALLGHVSAVDLAAAAVGSGIYISVIMALVGILQAIAPLVAHSRGAGDSNAIASLFRQGVWLAALLAVPGVLLMLFPEPLLALSSLDGVVEAEVRAYLQALAWGVPASLLHRTFHAFCTAVGRPRPLMVIALIGGLVHAPLAWFLLHFPVSPLLSGVAACGVSSAIVTNTTLLAGVFYLRRASAFSRYALLATWEWPRPGRLAEILRLGLPMGISSFVEITSFTLIALLAARLGADAVAGHRIAANLVALAYMLPLSLAVATLSEAGRSLGAGNRVLARQTVIAGLVLAMVLSIGTALATCLLAAPVISLFTDSPPIAAVSLSLVIYVALYQLFDAIQTVAGFALRSYKVTLLPMLIHSLSFWLIGLAGGCWLAFADNWQLGVTGFWQAAVASVFAAAAMLAFLLWRVSRSAGVGD